jgi:hypothetical protein
VLALRGEADDREGSADYARSPYRSVSPIDGTAHVGYQAAGGIPPE